jgi:hypothetical protein
MFQIVFLFFNIFFIKGHFPVNKNGPLIHKVQNKSYDYCFTYWVVSPPPPTTKIFEDYKTLMGYSKSLIWQKVLHTN